MRLSNTNSTETMDNNDAPAILATTASAASIAANLLATAMIGFVAMLTSVPHASDTACILMRMLVLFTGCTRTLALEESVLTAPRYYSFLLSREHSAWCFRCCVPFHPDERASLKIFSRLSG